MNVSPRSLVPILALLALWLSGSALAQVPAIPYQQLLLLVAGPSGDRIDPREKAVVDHLNGLRSNYNFSQLQMGTMHYDRPQEASLLKSTLGFSPQKGITVGLVQLSDKGLPVRTLYKLEGATQASLTAAQNELLSRWSKTTGQPLPRDLRPAGSAGGPTSQGGPVAANPPTANPPRSNPPTANPPTANPPRSNPPTANPPSAPPSWMPNIGTPSQVYTFEGIQYVVFEIDKRVGGMWQGLANAPARSDGNDARVREQTRALVEATQALRAAHLQGVIYPFDQLAAVARTGRAWQASEPQYYLPVPLRSNVAPMETLLQQVEEIYVQGTRARTN